MRPGHCSPFNRQQKHNEVENNTGQGLAPAHLGKTEERDAEEGSESQSLSEGVCVREGTTRNASANHSIPRRVLKRHRDAVITGVGE